MSTPLASRLPRASALIPTVAAFAATLATVAAVPLRSASAQACAGPTVIPIVHAAVPGSGSPGTAVVIQVEWNGVGACLEKVTFGDTRSPFAVWDGITSVTAVVPNRTAGSAPIIVDMYVGGPSDPFPFTVTSGGFVEVVQISGPANDTQLVDFTIRHGDTSLIDDGSFSVEPGDSASDTASAAVAAIEAGGLGDGLEGIWDADAAIVLGSNVPLSLSVCIGPTPCPVGGGSDLPQVVIGQAWGLVLPNVPALARGGIVMAGLVIAAVGALTSRSRQSPIRLFNTRSRRSSSRRR